MRKYLWATGLSVFMVLFVSAQSTEGGMVSLKMQLSSLNDTTRVNALNRLAEILATANNISSQQKADSIHRYANIAYDEAKTLRYKNGMAEALLNLGNAELLRGIGQRINKQEDSSSSNSGEKYLLEAEGLAAESANDALLGMIYYDLADVLFYKSKRKDYETRMNLLKKAVRYFRKTGNEKKEQEACTWICEDYSSRGLYEEGLDYCQRSLQLARRGVLDTKTNEEKEYRNYLLQQSLVDMAALYKEAGDYSTALGYIQQGRRYGIENKTGWEMESDLASLFGLMGRYDSATFYMNKVYNQNPDDISIRLALGHLYLKTKGPDESLKYLLAPLDSLRKRTTNGRPLMPSLLDIGEAYTGKKNYGAALRYANEATTIAYQLSARPELMQGYELLSRIHYLSGRSDSAYLYLRKYTALKDSIQSTQFIWRMNNVKRSAEDEMKTGQLRLLNKENQLKDQKLKQQAMVRNGLAAFLLLLLLFGVFVYRFLTLKRKGEKQRLQKDLEVQKLQSEQKHAELQRQAVELEMQALRAQMNPHFIFNCLSSINRFIFKNDNKAASDYLTRFSRLIRMVLVHSQRQFVSLEDELEMLRLYLDMERLRFKSGFDYSITTNNTIDAGAIFIPPLLLQPFCENAIWHGLMHKEGQGHLNISIREEEKVLYCTITDDGVGREKAALFNSKSAEKGKSLGLKITTARLALLNEERPQEGSFSIEDVLDERGNVAGTSVHLKIYYKDTTEETKLHVESNYYR